MKRILVPLWSLLVVTAIIARIVSVTPAWAAIDFPATPTTGQTYTYSGQTYIYNGSAWNTLTLGTNPAITKQVFTASGTYTPSSGMQYAIIECQGAGAAGGGVSGGATTDTSGGGGGAGGYSRVYVTAAQVGASQTVTVGVGGTAGTAGANDGNAPANDTSVGTLCIGLKGAVGKGASTGTMGLGGAGGAAGTGDLTGVGGAGTSGNAGSITTPLTVGGTGGTAFFGGAPKPVSCTSATTAGTSATGYGAGGGGACSNASASTASGGAGKDGIVIITEFLASSWSVTGGIPAQSSKVTDQTLNTSTTLASDNALTFPVLASTKYSFRFVVFYDTPTAADFKWQITCPASPTLVLYDGHALAPGATSETITRDNACSSAHSLTETSGTAGSIIIQGILQNGTTAGSVTFQWAQNTSNGSNTTVYGGSHVLYTRTQ